MNDKLLKIQSELKSPKGQTNTFAKYKYRSCEDILEAVKPLLKENKLTLVLTDEVVNIGVHNYVKSVAVLADGDTDTNAIHATAYAREAEDKKGMDDAQITGAASSYARKYALNGLFAIDDTKDADTKDNTHEPEIVAEMDKQVVKPQKATTKQVEMMFSLAKQQGYTEKADAHKWLTEQGDKDPLLMSSAEASKLIGELMAK